MSQTLVQTPDAGQAPSPLAIVLEAVSFTYRDAAAPALRNVTLRLERGQTLAVLGRSGAGKSTLAKTLNAIVPAFEEGHFTGAGQVCGRTLAGTRVAEVAPLVAMVFQDFEAQLFSTNVAHEVAFGLEQLGLPAPEIAARIEPALAMVGLQGFQTRDPTSLSGGEKQRLAIACALALRPQVIVLDEPTTDLDPQGRAEVFDLITRLRDQGLTLVVIEHETEELRRCDRLIVLEEGEIVADGTPEQILSQVQLLEKCGVRPPASNQVLAELGIQAYARDLDQAQALIEASLAGRAKLLGAASPDATLRLPLARANQTRHPASDVTPLVRIEGLSHTYHEAALPALDEVDLTVEAGEFVAIIGQNGSGKTSLAKHIVGLLQPQRGRVLLAGNRIETLTAAQVASLAGFVFQNPDHQIFAATVEDEVAFGPRNFGVDPTQIDARCQAVLRAVGLEHLRLSDPFLLGRGERQRLAVASVLVLAPKLLILDEPTTGLDYPQQLRMMKLVSELNAAGTAIVIITHTPWLVANYARRTVLMRHGRKLFDGGVAELFAQPKLLKEAAFRLPEVAELGRRLGINALTIAELVGALRGER
ncbi:MAG TPA: energy-coupling factor transporter ATPase [Candidatus Binataceae bacterium]|nr:energy-coupling factor transporter ATPase [Candidatus Binataceae bacterium]